MGKVKDVFRKKLIAQPNFQLEKTIQIDIYESLKNKS